MLNRSRSDHTRRDFLQRAGFAPLILTASKTSAKIADRTRPNIVFILADDLGSADLGCYGQKLIRTPRIDRMAREGMRFTQCYVGAAVCAPSRNVLMTGMHTGHTRIRGNSPDVGGTIETFGEGSRRLSLEASDVTVAEYLKKAGYATGRTGKWGLAEPDTAGIPNRKGFDEWFGYLNQNHAPCYFTPYLWKDERQSRSTVIATAEESHTRTTFSPGLPWTSSAGTGKTRSSCTSHTPFPTRSSKCRTSANIPTGRGLSEQESMLRWSAGWISTWDRSSIC